MIDHHLTFSDALAVLKAGGQVQRKGWNGKSMWLQLVSADCWLMTGDAISDSSFSLDRAPWIGMRTADNKFVPWLASQTDLLAEDWEMYHG